jgi:hypothetical protein
MNKTVTLWTQERAETNRWRKFSLAAKDSIWILAPHRRQVHPTEQIPAAQIKESFVFASTENQTSREGPP